MNIERAKSALEPDHHSRSAYAGRVTQKETFTIHDEAGNPIHVERQVILTWDSIKAVMAMIKDRAQI